MMDRPDTLTNVCTANLLKPQLGGGCSFGDLFQLTSEFIWSLHSFILRDRTNEESKKSL